MTHDLPTNPKVVRMSVLLKTSSLTIVGALHRTWCLFDTHAVDGTLMGYDQQTLDAMVGLEGWHDAMVAVDWLKTVDGGISVPRFDAHNGQSAKNRALDRERKRRAALEAEKFQKNSGSEPEELRTREEYPIGKEVEESYFLKSVELEQPTSPAGDDTPTAMEKPKPRGKQANAHDICAIAQQQYKDVFPSKRVHNLTGMDDTTLKGIRDTADTMAQKVLGVADCQKLSRDDIEALWHLFWKRCSESDRLMGRSQSPKYNKPMAFTFSRAGSKPVRDAIIGGTQFDLPDSRTLADIWNDLFGQREIAA